MPSSTWSASSGCWRTAARSSVTQRARRNRFARRSASGAARRWPICATKAFAIAALPGLEELRAAASEDVIDAELELDHHRETLPEIDRLIARYPFRERLRAQKMLALYRSGRQADALDAYREARSSLVDELGIEPGAELRDLETAILTQDARLAAPAPPERAPAPARGSPRRSRRRSLLAAFSLALLAAVVLVVLVTGGKSKRPPIVGNVVVALDPSSGRIQRTVSVGGTPTSVAANADGIHREVAGNKSIGHERTVQDEAAQHSHRPP